MSDFDQDQSPYPQSTDRVEVIVFCTKTGNIKQVVKCSLSDSNRHHAVFPDHDYLEVTGEDVSPHDQVVDLATMKVVPRTVPNARDRRAKENELIQACEDAKPDLYQILTEVLAEDAGAMKTARESLASRKAQEDRLASLLNAVAAAKTRDELAAISW